MSLDRDGDTLLVRVDQAGSGACHTGDRTCFGAAPLAAAVGARPGSASAPAAAATPAADPEAASPS